ncbi:MAG: NADH-quinone oxidoreductase subunit M [Actinobacteria bacterium]|nr:NADH-quinone oxidoreductase subunit M [Actinomycetota bacterium]
MGPPILSTLIALPALGAAVAAAIPSHKRDAIRTTALATTIVTFLASLVMYARFEAGVAAFQLEEHVDWIPAWGVRYSLGVDGITLFLVLLCTFLMPVAVGATWGQVPQQVKGFYASVLVLESAMIGVFVALDLILFYVFFEAMLVPMYILIGVWGGERRKYAAVKFFLYTLVGGFLMLVGILYLYFKGGAQTFDYSALLQVPLTITEETLLFGAFFIAFAIKVPLFPFHTWLPDAHTEAPTIGSVDLAAILLKIGGYGILRFLLPYFPAATRLLAPGIVALSVVGVLYGALVAMMQSDIKRLVAYSSVAHMGFVILGVFALDVTSASGSVVQMVNHGLSTGALFILVGFMYERTHSRVIAEYSGLAKAAPVFGGVFLLVVLSSLALPGLNGFVGEFPILIGAFQTMPAAAVTATFGVVLAALYLLWAYQRMFHGPVEGSSRRMPDLNPREVAVMVPVVALIIGIGLYPKPLYDRVTPTIEQMITHPSLERTARAEPPRGPAAVAARTERSR